MYYIGIDAGSTYIKAVLVSRRSIDQIDVLCYNMISSGADMKENIIKVFNLLLKEAGISKEEVKAVTGTGYGGNIVRSELGGRIATQIKCLAKGAKYLFPTCRTVIDIGGQDTKVIKLDEIGNVINFEMNDKCAAGTGRFLEVMSRVLDVSISEFGKISLQAKNKARITSTCTVFAETEVVSLISRGIPKEEIIAGLTESIASRIAGLAKIVGIERDVVITGGVAKNIGVVKALESKLGSEIKVPEEPIITGALGAALLSYES
jgi:predicted CoA-substrate-specific enzyme activase